MGLTDFCRQSSPPAVDLAARTQLPADVLLSGPVGRKESIPFVWRFGVCGVGVLANDAGILTSVLFSTESPQNQFMPLNAILSTLIADLLDEIPAWLSDVRLLGVPAPEPQISPGDAISCPNLSGSAGCNVRWATKTGFLIAGHVGGASHGACNCGGLHVGSIVYCNNPSNHGANIEADVGVVELNSGIIMQNAFTTPSAAGPNAAINVVTNQGSRRAYLPTNVRGYSRWQYSPSLNGTWGDVYHTMNAVTQPGNSGSPVIDSSQGVIGHVVGALPNVATLIQDIHYQLTILGQQSMLNGITI